MCFFEINYIMKTVMYPGLFHCALHISRMIDVAPEVELKVKLLNTQRELTKSLMCCEIICKSRELDNKWDEEIKTVEEKVKEKKLEIAGKKKSEEKKNEPAKALPEAEAEPKAAEEPLGMSLRSGKVLPAVGPDGKPEEPEKPKEEGDLKVDDTTNAGQEVKAEEATELVQAPSLPTVDLT